MINFPATVEDLGLTTFPRFDTLFKTIEMVANVDSKSMMMPDNSMTFLSDDEEGMAMEDNIDRKFIPSVCKYGDNYSVSTSKSSIAIAWPLFIKFQYKFKERVPILAPWTIPTSIYSARRKESISDAYYNSSDGFKKCFLYDWKMLNRKGRFVTF